MNNEESDLLDVQVHKSLDTSWLGLLVLSIFIFVSSIIAMIVLFICWRRCQRQLNIKTTNQSFTLSQQPTGKRQIPVQFEDKPYETQQMDVFVSSNENERMPYPRFSDPEDIQRVQQFYERTTKAYF